MNLFVNGCSFSAGHSEVHDEQGNLTPPLEYVWSNQIADKFDNITNYALAGGSNDRIFRTTMEYFSKGPTDTIAVIQWTAPIRFEIYNEIFKTWLGICNNTTTNVRKSLANSMTDKDLTVSIHMDDGLALEKFRNHKAYNKIVNASQQQLMFLKSLNDYQIQFYKNVYVLEQYFKSNNIPFLFTSMSFYNHIVNATSYTNIDTIETPPTKLEIDLKNILDKSSWTAQPFTGYMDTNYVSKEDHHPNQEGHRLISEAIVSELSKRNYI
jgi:hypothetical protein